MFKNNFILLRNFKNDHQQFSSIELKNNNKINDNEFKKIMYFKTISISIINRHFLSFW